MGKDLNGKELGSGIQQRKNGSYCARYVNQYGKRISIYEKDLRVLKKKMTMALANDMKGLSSKDGTMTLDEWKDIWVNAYKRAYVRESTLSSYNDFYKHHIQKELGSCKLSAITKVQCTLLLNRLKAKGLGWECLNRAKILMIDMFDRAIEDQYLARNPMRGVRNPLNKPEDERHIMTVSEQNSFFECAAGTFYNNLFVTAVNSGLRPGELFALTEDDIDFENGYINVKHTLLYQKLEGDECKTFHLHDPKTKGSKRKVPMNASCREALEKQVKQKKVIAERGVKDVPFSDRLFVTRFNTPLNSQLYASAIDSIIKEMNTMLPPIEQWQKMSGHTFRHTFATRCIESGIQPKTVQKYLGHATLKMTMDLYVHTTDEYSSEEIKKLDGVSVAYGDKVVVYDARKSPKNQQKWIAK